MNGKSILSCWWMAMAAVYLTSLLHTHTHTHRHLPIYIYAYTHMLIYISTYIYIYITMLRHTYTYIYDDVYRYICAYMYTHKHTHIYIPGHWLMSRVFSSGPGDRGSIQGRVIPKTQNMVFEAALLNTEYYKERIKGKVEQSRNYKSALPYSSAW